MIRSKTKVTRITQQNSIVVRNCQSKDVASLRKIYLETRRLTFPWLKDQPLLLSDFDKDTADERIWICEYHGVLVGFIAVQPDEKFIHHLFVLTKYAGYGFGTQLLEQCLNEIGYPARLKCVSENEKALHFYKALGWKTIETAYSSDGEYHLMELNQPSS